MTSSENVTFSYLLILNSIVDYACIQKYTSLKNAIIWVVHIWAVVTVSFPDSKKLFMKLLHWSSVMGWWNSLSCGQYHVQTLFDAKRWKDDEFLFIFDYRKCEYSASCLVKFLEFDCVEVQRSLWESFLAVYWIAWLMMTRLSGEDVNNLSFILVWASKLCLLICDRIRAHNMRQVWRSHLVSIGTWDLTGRNSDKKSICDSFRWYASDLNFFECTNSLGSWMLLDYKVIT